MSGTVSPASPPPDPDTPLSVRQGEDVDALIRVYQEKLRYYEELYRTRPGADGHPVPPTLDQRLIPPSDMPSNATAGVLDPSALDPAAKAATEHLARLSQDPRFQRAIEILSDATLQTHARALIDSGKEMHLLYAQAAWALVIMLVKAWRLSRARVWHQRLGVRIWTSGLYWMGALMGLPMLIYGKPYLQLVARLIELLAPRG